MLVLAIAALAALFYLLLARRRIFVWAGSEALRKQAETMRLVRAPDGWRDPATAEWLAAPLRAKGFVDLGVYEVTPIPDARLGVLLNEQQRVAAFLCEYPKALAVTLELNVRYDDGNTTALVNHPDNGVPPPPFFHVIYAEPDTPSDALYERLLRERPAFGIKSISAESVIPEYEAAWARMVRWQRERGLTPEEVARIAVLRRRQSKA